MLPYYPFYWADYSSKTYDLTQGQHGAYMLFLRHIYTTGQPIPDKQRFSIARALLTHEQENADFVLQKFFQKDGDIWRMPRAEQVIAEQQKKHQRRVIAGKKGGKKKASNATAKPEQCSSNQNQNQNQNQIKDIKDLSNVKFDIDFFLDDDARHAARAAARGWDQQQLIRHYNEWVNEDLKKRKPTHPAQAFIAWCAKFTKGKKP